MRRCDAARRHAAPHIRHLDEDVVPDLQHVGVVGVDQGRRVAAANPAVQHSTGQEAGGRSVARPVARQWPQGASGTGSGAHERGGEGGPAGRPSLPRSTRAHTRSSWMPDLGGPQGQAPDVPPPRQETNNKRHAHARARHSCARARPTPHPPVKVDLGARAARPLVPHLPEVLLAAVGQHAAGRQEAQPDLARLLVRRQALATTGNKDERHKAGRGVGGWVRVPAGAGSDH